MPETSRDVAAVLPDGIDLKSQPLRLQGRTRALPLFSWDLTAPEIETASHVLFWLLAPLLPLTLVSLFYLRRYRHPLVLQLSVTQHCCCTCSRNSSRKPLHAWNRPDGWIQSCRELR